MRFTTLYHSSCPNRTCAECDKFEENNLSHCKNISWFSMFLFHEFFMVLCSYWVKLLQITNKLDSYCGIKSISHVDLCDKWRSVWYGLLSHSADASCDKSPYHTLLHLSHSSIVRYTLKSHYLFFGGIWICMTQNHAICQAYRQPIAKLFLTPKA